MIRPEIRKEKPRQEWREPGFYYERDDSAKKWIFIADRKGLGMWTRLLREWAQEPLNAEPSENHDHYGPYMYLRIDDVGRIFQSTTITSAVQLKTL